MTLDRIRVGLQGLCTLLCLQGLSWTILGSFEPTGWYDGLLARSQLGLPALPPEAARIFAFALIPFGATDAAYFALVGLIARHAADQVWAWRAVTGSFLLWFVVDSVGCAWIGAWFNVLVVNLPCLALFGAALIAWRRALPK